jgi:DNA-binding transcriptional LysR family regulator
MEVVPVRGWLVMSTALALRRAALDGLGPALLADWLIDADIAHRRLTFGTAFDTVRAVKVLFGALA